MEADCLSSTLDASVSKYRYFIAIRPKYNAGKCILELWQIILRRKLNLLILKFSAVFFENFTFAFNP